VATTPKLAFEPSSSLYSPDEADAATWAAFSQAWIDGNLRGVTMTIPTTLFGCAGETAVNWVSLTTLNEAAAALPNVTDVVPVKPVPVIVTVVPPIVGPFDGLIEVIVGPEP
jgi:hypothetical protein